jgi:hypothetical protein
MMEITTIAPTIAAINSVDRHTANNVSQQRVDSFGQRSPVKAYQGCLHV